MVYKQWNVTVLIGILIFSWIGISIAADSTATGTVFLDTNKNEIKDDNEKGLSGVRVSNGQDVVQTDANGKYSLAVSDDTILFVIKPRGYMTPTNENRLPKFYYIHKPHGSPEGLKYAGVAPTGPLPESIDFPLTEQSEPDTFKALVFGDTQPNNMQEIEWLAHDVVEEVIGTDAVFGLSLGDLVGDNLNLFHPLNEVMATVGIPWYNVYGNHDMNRRAKVDRFADETFERVYGPTCYSYDWGPVHFINIDNVHWSRDEENNTVYFSEVGERQLTFIRNDLAFVPKDQLVVISMHIPLTEMRDVQKLMNLLGDRPNTLSLSAHTHVQHDDFIGPEHGWHGDDPHHHHNHATASGSWWQGTFDEIGIPHTTMRDGAPNGYGIFTFSGNQYSIRFKASRRPADYQMNIWAPWEVAEADTSKTDVLVNIFGGTKLSKVEMRLGDIGKWKPMSYTPQKDPYFQALRKRDETYDLERKMHTALRESMKPLLKEEEQLPQRGKRLSFGVPKSTHIWQAKLPANFRKGTHVIYVRTTDMFGQTFTGRRIIRVR
ncbi:MAG: calcineurin-like phosphoesterase family protein [Candidatus Poribacteria bacterium]|nr:calcineurin-like phosphoesterase family protein [Candidatus Poribacteria bacterium]